MRKCWSVYTYTRSGWGVGWQSRGWGVADLWQAPKRCVEGVCGQSAGQPTHTQRRVYMCDGGASNDKRISTNDLRISAVLKCAEVTRGKRTTHALALVCVAWFGGDTWKVEGWARCVVG